MHKVLNVKHRIVRRTHIERAPLATFDTIDLGDEDKKASRKSIKPEGNSAKKEALEITLCDVGIQKTETIGGNHSKKALSQAGGEGKEEKAAEPPTESNENCCSLADDTKFETNPIAEEKQSEEKDGRRGDKNEELSKSPITEYKESLPDDVKKPRVPALASASLTRQGTLGRVSIPIKKQNSVSSSSSSEACNDSHFTFTTSRPSIAHLDSAEGGYDVPDSYSHKGSVSNLVPDNIDPKQILSPSKRKAYEKRLERLKVTTSPIARPRSNAPINVVTLDEYANISSPEHSPLSHSILQDKLKITLPCDEFNRGSKLSSSKRKDSEDTCFEFSEEILFRCTKSALVVDEDGQLPISPRRVLIPPTITPTNSPKLSSSPRLSADSTGDNTQTNSAPKLIYMKEDDPAHKFFGLTFDESGDDNWADFPDSSSVNVEKAETENSEKEEYSNNICGKGQSDTVKSPEVIKRSVADENIDACKDGIVKSSPFESEDNFSVGISDKTISDLDEKADSTPESSDILDEISPLNTSENHSSGADLVETHIAKGHSVEEQIQLQLESVDSSDFYDKTKHLDIGIPFADDAEESKKDVTGEVTENKAVSASDDNVLIQLSNSISKCENPVSFVERGFSPKPCDEIDAQHCHAISTNPFSLLDAPTDIVEPSMSLQTQISSSDILQPTTTLHAHTNSSTSLNPFLQDVTATSESDGLDFSDFKDITTESAAANVESLNHPPLSHESHPSFIDLNISTAKSSSTDLIDFSSLDLDLSAPQ